MDDIKDPEKGVDYVGSRLVRVVSLNCWGLKYVSKHREQRLSAIAEKLGKDAERYDVIALQEVWVEADFRRIRDAVAGELPYAHYYYSGMLAGPGLAVLSRWPIEDVALHRFSLNGRPSAFYRGDWFVGKSVASAVVRHPLGSALEVFNAHLHAPYGPGDASYTCHRTAQAWEMARLLSRSRAAGHLVVAVGDLNSRPGSLTYRLFQLVGGLSDAWVERHGEFRGAIGSLSPADQIALAGATCDSQLNTWRAHRRIDEAVRLDYIFFDAGRASAREVRVSFTEQVAGVGTFSDHFAIEADLELTPMSTRPLTGGSGAVSNASTTVSAASTALFDDILAVVDDYAPTARLQKLVRIAHFYVSILATIALLVAVFWGAADGRAYVAFIFMLAAIALMVTGVVDGLIGFLFGRNEARALTQFRHEILIARSRHD